MSKIRRIEESLYTSLQSQVKLNKLSDVIRELIQNGVDANADNIKINLKINFIDKNIELNYTDNGDGIDPNSLEDFGKRFFTSKLYNNNNNNNNNNNKNNSANEITYDKESDLSHLKSVKTFGFRGEAINSLLHICSSVMVASKVKDYNNGFNVIFKGSQRIGNIIKCNKLIPNGTQIKINGLFDPIIVRKKILFDNLENSWISENFDIKKIVIDSLINKPFIKIEILKEEFKKNKWNKRMIIKNLNNNKNLIIDKIPLQLQMNLFNFIFGGNLCEDYELCKVQFKEFKLITGIGLKTSQTKNYQFFYLNGRPFYNNEFKKYINQLFQKHYELWGENLKINDNNYNKNKKSTSMYGKPYSINPIFIAKFEFPIEISDLLQDPSKVCYSTKNLKIMMILFNKVINVYFRIFKEQKLKNNKRLLPNINKDEFINDNKRQKIINNYLTLKSNIRISKFEQFEMNGRLNDNYNSKKKINEETENKIYNINKITESLNKKDEKREEILISNNNDNNNDNNNNNNNNNNIKCNHSNGILSQEELKNQSIFFKKVNKLELNRDDLKEFKLISQVDNKFILVKYRNRIICLDQHAICERIKLEKMYKELINQCFKIENVNNDILNEKIPISFMTNEIELIKKYQETLKFWGIEFDENFANIINLPIIILNKFLKIEFSVLKKGILEFIYNLHEKEKLDINNNNINSNINNENFFWWIKYLSHMPEVYKEIIKSKACRSSIMFGDYISRDEINMMLKELTRCYQPFECAHGRPSLYPLCEI